MSKLTLGFALCLASGVVLLAPAPAKGARHWDAGGDGCTWEDPANWDGDTAPQAGQDVLLSNAVTVVVSNSTPTLNGLTVSNATLTLTN